ncbi:MAG: hypothetical protein LBR26_07745 [Prevotella sp.]|nr:hypothetical protein [Prevotella sp.]
MLYYLGITEEQYLQEQEEAAAYELEQKELEKADMSEAQAQIDEKIVVSLKDEAVSLGATEKQLAELFNISDYIDLIEQLKYGKRGQTGDAGTDREQIETAAGERDSAETAERRVGDGSRSTETEVYSKQDSPDKVHGRASLTEEQRIVNEAAARIDAEIAEIEKELYYKEKELGAARKRLGKAQAETQGSLFGNEQQAALFDVPADLYFTRHTFVHKYIIYIWNSYVHAFFTICFPCTKPCRTRYNSLKMKQ